MIGRTRGGTSDRDSDGHSTRMTLSSLHISARPPQASAVDENVSLRDLAESAGVAFREHAGDALPSAEFLDRVPIAYARRHAVLGLSRDTPDQTLPLLLGTRQSWRVVDVLERMFGEVEPIFVPLAELRLAINRSYENRTGQAASAVAELEEQTIVVQVEGGVSNTGASGGAGGDDLLDSGGRAPVVKLVNMMLFEAVKQARWTFIFSQGRIAQLCVFGSTACYSIPSTFRPTCTKRWSVESR